MQDSGGLHQEPSLLASSAAPPREASTVRQGLFNGMRVRMGMATGLLPPGSQAKGSAVMELAKGERWSEDWGRGGGRQGINAYHQGGTA